MTQDEIYEMAHQAGVENEFNYDYRLSLETFANLVAAKEKEACAKVVQTHLDASDDLRTKGTLASVLDYIKFRGEQA